MKFSPEDKNVHSVVPPNLRCVWMTAGILSYQLCDRQFDCDNCPLDAAMRMHFAKPGAHISAPARTSNEFTEEYFSRNHCWIRSASHHRVRIGLEPGFASVLQSPRAAILPALNEKVRYNEFCAWIVLDGGTIPIRAPLSGSVVAVNTTLADQPGWICSSSSGEGWLFEAEIKADEHVRSHLMKKEEMERLFAHDQRHFQELVSSAINNSATGVGLTLHDGGELIANASAMLGANRYVEILKEVFCR